ncbi:hypothetical protein CR513_20124, partial [Mucuna pruriens]
MENQDRTLKELAMLDVVYQPWCIDLIHLLPKFHGLAGEDPHKHLKEFHMVAGDTRRLHQDEGVPVFSRRSSKELVVPATSSFQHLGRHEMHLLGEVLPGVQNCDYLEGNMWNPTTCRRNLARILGKI